MNEENEIVISNENTPKIYIEFSISGKKNIPIDVNKIYKLMNIPTAEIVKKCDKTSKFDCYKIKTKECQIYEIEEEVKKLIVLLQDKKDIINYIHNNFKNIYIGFCVIGVINNGVKPFFDLSNETLKFIADIKANFDINLFINPWNGED